MKPVAPRPQNSRPYFYKAQDRIAKPLLRLLRISPLRLSRSLRSRKNKRSRRDQLTIEILRYRLDHPDAMVEQAGQMSYSDAFKNFVLSRYTATGNLLTAEQFARAAGIAVETMRVWLAQAQNPLVEETRAALPAEKVPAHASGVSTKLSEHFEKWLSVTRDFLDATGDELGWRAYQIKSVLSKVITVMIRALPKRLAYRHYDKIAELTPPATVFFTGYGAQALKRDYQKNLSRALLISLALHFTVLCVYLGINDFTRSDSPVRTMRIMIYPELESKLDETSLVHGSLEMDKNRRGWANGGRGTSPAPLLAESNTLLPLRVLPADYATTPPGPNAPDNTLTTDMPMVDIAGLQALANQGIPSSIAGNGTTPLLHFVPKPGNTPKIDLASVGGEEGTVLPSNNLSGPQAQLLGLGTAGDGFNPTLEAAKTGYAGGGSIGKPYSTGRSGSLPYRGNAAGSGSGGKPSLIANDRKSDRGGPEKLVLKSSGEKDWRSRDLKKLFHDLLEWMSENPYEFPPALKHYMRFRPGDITSRVTITTNEKEYELFMLCNEASEDFGLLLVAEGDSTDAICLRDTGFRKQSFYLSKGIAGRNESAAVGSMSMLEQRPTFHETSKFYNIFLSWWDKTKAGDVKKS